MPAKRMRSQRIFTAAFVACSTTLLLVSCSSSGSSKSSSGSSTTSPQAASSAEVTGMGQIDQTLEKYSGQAPINLTPLPAKPPTGKKVIILTNSASPGDIINGQSFIAATKVLGWAGSIIDYAGDPASLASAFQQAISAKPAAIQVDGQSLSAFAPSLKAANAAGIPVFEIAATSAPTGMSAGGLAGAALGPNFIQTEGQIGADWILKNSGGKVNVAIVTLPALGVLVQEDNAFIAELSKRCPECKTKVINAQITDIGRALPATVTSTLQADPSFNYVFFPYGDTSVGVSAALKAAGISAKLVTTTADDDQYAQVKTGGILMALSTSNQVQAWLAADSIARYFETNKTVDDDIAPVQIFDSTDDSAASLPVSPSDYQAQFKKLWHIS